MDGLTDNHKSRILVTFRSVDEVLDEVAGLLDPARQSSPFSRVSHDATPVQHKVICDYVARVRQAMREVLERMDVEPPAPTTGAVWAARTALTSADVAIEELKARYIKGYGPLGPEAARWLDGVVAHLSALLDRMQAFLGQRGGRDLRARLQGLDDTSADVRLLRELERVVTRHGLVEFRGTLDMLAERLESPALEAAVFGRVSSGKSSLLDHLLETDALPVGVTPVTAVPTRIKYGPQARVTVSFAELEPQVVSASRLAEFATEQHNPANAKHVTRIELELPSARLKDGLTFVDTPGLGSLAAVGAAEALAYVPRCDLGIVLVDASSTLTEDDVVLAHALAQAGAEVMVLLSKADALSPEERARSLDYTRARLSANLGFDVPVFAVSVRGPAAPLCDEWVSDVLQPLLRRQREHAAASVGRKIDSLRELVAHALGRRAGSPPPVTEAYSGPDALGKADERIGVALSTLEAARRATPAGLDRAEVGSEGLLDDLASAAAALLCQDHRRGIGFDEFARPILARHGHEMAAPVVRQLAQVRSSLEAVLREATCGLPGGSDDWFALPQLDGMPSLDVDSFPVRPLLERPRLGLLGTGVLNLLVRRQLAHAVGPALEQVLHESGRRLEGWRVTQLAKLRRAFLSRADLCQAVTAGEFGRTTGAQAAAIDDLAMLERFAPADESQYEHRRID